MSDTAGPGAATPSPEYLAESRQATIRGVTWMSVSAPMVVVAARLYTRLCLRKVFGLDDWLIVASMALLVSYGGVIEAAVGKGLGRHAEYVMINMPQNAISIALLGQVAQPLVIMACALGKTSFIITLLRIGSQRWVTILLWFILVTMNLLHILVAILLFFRCEDPRVLWDTTIETTCWPVDVYLHIMNFIGAYSAATDFMLALIPWMVLWNLNMKRKEKAGVAVAMSLGVFAGATAIIKTTYLKANSVSKDPTYDVGELLLWAGAENALIIVSASVPTLRPLLRAISPSTNKSSGNSHPLKNMPSNLNNVFTPKSKRGQWSAIVETEGHAEQNSDNNSDKSILKQDNRPQIRKMTEVNVSYDQN